MQLDGLSAFALLPQKAVHCPMKHILCIDDEEEIREVLEEMLVHKGYRVSSVGTAVEARRVVAESPPDLIISDLQMTDTDGLVLLEELKKTLPKVPVMLLTGVVFEPEVVRETIQKLVNSYVDKTSSLERIVSEIRRLLGET